VPGEDVEDDRRAVDDRRAERLLEVAALARRQLVVAGDDVRVGRLDGLSQLLKLARPEIRVRMRALEVLHHPADGRDAGGAQQLLQLREVVAPLEHSDRERTLTRAPHGRLAAPRRRRDAAIPVLHGRHTGESSSSQSGAPARAVAWNARAYARGAQVCTG
jgi:hypothetical protein